MVKTEEEKEVLVLVEPEDFLKRLFSLTQVIQIFEPDLYKVLYSRVTLPGDHGRGGRVPSKLPLFIPETKLWYKGQWFERTELVGEAQSEYSRRPLGLVHWHLPLSPAEDAAFLRGELGRPDLPFLSFSFCILMESIKELLERKIQSTQLLETLAFRSREICISPHLCAALQCFIYTCLGSPERFPVHPAPSKTRE